MFRKLTTFTNISAKSRYLNLSAINNNIQSSSTHETSETSSEFANEGDHFRYLLRNSKLVNLGDAENKVVTGKIFHVVKDDLYVDFGWKFYCVCPRPTINGSAFVRGAKVLLRLKDLELSSRFLGAEKDITLLEADGHIISLISTPKVTK